MSMNPQQLKNIVEAALLASGEPLTVERIQALFLEHEMPAKDELSAALEDLMTQYAASGIELKEVGSGFRIQIKAEMAPWVSRLWEERPQRYSRATLETLALIAYRQPISRAEIENVRGVSVSTQIIKTLSDREWIRIVGHREVPGRPALYGTTRGFLDYFNLRSLEELPTLAEVRNLDDVARSLDAALQARDMPPVVDNDDAELDTAAFGQLDTVALPLAAGEAAAEAASTEPPRTPPPRPVRNDAREQPTSTAIETTSSEATSETLPPQAANG